MGTVFVEQADPSLSVAKSDEIFAEQAHAHRRTIGLGNFFREQSGNPIAPNSRPIDVPGCTRVNSSFSSFESMISLSYGRFARIVLSSLVASAVS